MWDVYLSIPSQEDWRNRIGFGILGYTGFRGYVGLLSQIYEKRDIPVKNRIPQIWTDKHSTIFGPAPISPHPVFGPVSVYPVKTETNGKNMIYGCGRNGISLVCFQLYTYHQGARSLGRGEWKISLVEFFGRSSPKSVFAQKHLSRASNDERDMQNKSLEESHQERDTQDMPNGRRRRKRPRAGLRTTRW
jgi:hypothetical protein